VPSPLIHGYELNDDGTPMDLSESFASGWAWASGALSVARERETLVMLSQRKADGERLSVLRERSRTFRAQSQVESLR